MKIIALKSYKTGYVGILEEKDRYVYFNLSKRGRYKEIRFYPKQNYCSLEHFIDTLTKFTPRRFFLKDALTVDAMTLEAFHEGLKDFRLNRYDVSRRGA